MKETTQPINWQGYADGTAIRAAIIKSIEREIQIENYDRSTSSDLESLRFFQR